MTRPRAGVFSHRGGGKGANIDLAAPERAINTLNITISTKYFFMKKVL